MQRRDLFKQSSVFAAGAALAACGGGNAAAPGKKNFLLVHGAWHAGVHWNNVAKVLTGLGHNVFAIDLPGSGLNAVYPSSYLSNNFTALASEPSPAKDIHLSDYRDAVVAQINKMAETAKVTLVGHSFGGLTITLAGEAIADKIERLVYLTAYVPVRLKSAAEYNALPENSTSQSSNIQIGDAGVTGGIRINPRNGDPAYVEKGRQAFYNDVPTAEYVKFANYLNPDLSLTAALEDGRGTTARWGTIPRTFIRCTLDHAIPIALQDRMIAEADASTPNNRFDVKTLASSHSAFASMPDTLANLLNLLT